MFPCFTESDCQGNDCRNGPKHGFRRHLERRAKWSEIMFELGNPTAKLFQKLNFTQFVGRRCSINFLNFPYICLQISLGRRGSREKKYTYVSGEMDGKLKINWASSRQATNTVCYPVW